MAVDAPHLLEIGELGDFHAIEPDLPAQAPGTQGGIFPIVLDEADIVLRRGETQCLEGTQVALENVGGSRFQHHLELVVVLQAVGVVAVAAILGPTRGLHVGGAPGLRPQGTQEGGGVAGAGAHLQIVRLQEHTTLVTPILLQAQDEFLESLHGTFWLAPRSGKACILPAAQGQRKPHRSPLPPRRGRQPRRSMGMYSRLSSPV
jgi:hypothetical protein